MKSYLSIFLMTVFAIMSAGNVYAQQKEAAANTKMTWDEAKEAYHSVMAGTFHPAEEGNFNPIKEKFGELIKNAKAWAAIDVPADLQVEKLDDLLDKLSIESVKIGDLVKGGASDEELKTAIYALHDVFHEIVGLCEH